jgi:hypothetical protein
MKNKYGYISLESHPFSEAEDILTKACEVSRFHGRKLMWLRLIRHGGSKLVCPYTSKTPHTIRHDLRNQKRGGYTFHWNIYSEDGSLLTIDHIIPQSKEGSKTHISNLQVMESAANREKGDLDVDSNWKAINNGTGK